MQKKRFPFLSKERSSLKNESFFSKKKLGVIIFVLVVMLVVLSFFFYLKNSDYDSLKKEYSSFVVDSKNTIFSLNEKISLLEKNNSDLNKALINLNNAYDSLSSKSDKLEESYSTLKIEVEGTIKKIDEYKAEIQSSLDWFNYNSLLGKEGFSVLSKLKSNCKSENSKSCEINLGCFNLVNFEFLKYEYKNDLVTSNTLDKLQSVSQFIKNKGGDCEDFSLFFKAEYNSLTQSCEGKEIKLVAWVRKDNDRFWLNFDSSWYLPDAKKVYLSKENIFPAIVCGSMYDPRSKKINGHCVLAFSNKKIVSFQDISVLASVELIEPQSGEYLGFIGDDSGVFVISYLGGSVSSLSYIDTIITDNDFFIYKDGLWNNYAKFNDELSLKKEKLESLLEE